jgi:hypothetical protein
MQSDDGIEQPSGPVDPEDGAANVSEKERSERTHDSPRLIVGILCGGLVILGLVLFSQMRSTSESTIATPGRASSTNDHLDAARTAAAVVLEKYSSYSFLDLVPITRYVTSSTFPSQSSFTYEGVSLSLPWTGDAKEQSLAGVGTQIKFPDGNFVMLVNPYPDPLHRQQFLSGLHGAQNDIFDTKALATDSAFFDLVMNSSLEELAHATSAGDLVATSLLLPLKLMTFYDSSTTAIYRFATPRFTVFEFTGLPAKRQSYIYYYDAKDEGRLLTTSASQEEIDFIFSSISPL